MRATRLSHRLFILFLFSIIVCTYALQQHLILKGDVSWFMHIAKLCLHQGQYVKDFFEINPPLAIYLYMPATLLQLSIPLSASHAIFIYCTGLGLVSLFLCYHLSLLLFNTDDKTPSRLFITILSVVYWILPLSEFGQREVLSLYFIMPYLTLISIRCKGAQTTLLFANIIGILAGIGFSLKPHYLLLWGLIELYYMTQSKRLTLRPETLCVGLFGLIYLILTALFHTPYLFIIVPMTKQFYYAYSQESWLHLLANPLCLWMCSMPIIYGITYHLLFYKKIATLLTISIITSLIIYVIQGSPWYYHLYPALSFSVLFAGFLFFSAWGIASSLTDRFFLIVCITLLLAYPIYNLYDFYQKNASQKIALEPIVALLKQEDYHQGVYAISSQISYMPTLIDQAQANYISRMQVLSWLKYFFTFDTNQKLSAQQHRMQAYFVNLMAEDFANQKPKTVLVDSAFYLTGRNTLLRVNYIPILLHYPAFQKQWINYHFVNQRCELGAYCFDVYERS